MGNAGRLLHSRAGEKKFVPSCRKKRGLERGNKGRCQEEEERAIYSLRLEGQSLPTGEAVFQLADEGRLRLTFQWGPRRLKGRIEKELAEDPKEVRNGSITQPGAQRSLSREPFHSDTQARWHNWDIHGG